MGGSPPRPLSRAWYTRFLVLRLQVSDSHSSFLRVAAGIVPHPTQVRTRGFLRCIWSSPRSSERGRLGMSGGSKAELTGSHLNICRLFVPPARVHNRLPRVSVSPSRALPWPISRQSLQVIYGRYRNEGSRTPISPKTPREARGHCQDWCAFNAYLQQLFTKAGCD